MKPVHQTILKPPYGNCLQAAVASILELDLQDVPNFARFMDFENPDNHSWWNFYETWLSQYSLQPLGVLIDDGWKPRGWHLIIGDSPRGDYEHAIVGYDCEPKHDPYPGGNCELASINAYEVFMMLDASKAVVGSNNKDVL